MKMNNIKIHSIWGLNFDLFSDKQVSLWVDFFDNIHNDKSDIKILFLCEPDPISKMASAAIKNKDKFDFILTHNEKVLKKCNNAILFEYGSSWIDNYSFPQKEFSVSTVVGLKATTQGHFLRHDLWRNRNNIKINKKFYVSSNSYFEDPSDTQKLILKDKKEPLFNSMFHIAIENSALNYYFTEKLIDCFQTKTVPIYWGCPNIKDYFNTKGMFLVRNVEDIIHVCNNFLTEEKYEEMLPFVEENYNLSMKYKKLEKRLPEKLKELIGGVNENDLI